jgi:hypothetical protein
MEAHLQPPAIPFPKWTLEQPDCPIVAYRRRRKELIEEPHRRNEEELSLGIPIPKSPPGSP